MSSTYSTNLAIELIGAGDQAGNWGSTTNTNLGTLIEQAISGYVTQSVSTGTDTTMTIPSGASNATLNARNMFIELTGTGGANTNLVVPANKKLYFIYNNTSSGQVTVKVSGQTGISVANATKVILVSNGTDIINATSYGVAISGALPVSGGGTGVVTLTGLAYGNGTSAFTAATGTQIATAIGTDAVTNATNATNAVNVTSTVPVNKGGTGSTSLTANNVLLGNGTSAVQVVAPGTIGNLLTSNGTTWTSTAPAAGGTVTSVATGNGLSGGTITSTGTLIIACPTNQTVGAYAIGQDSGGYSVGTNYSNPLSIGAGTWKCMSGANGSGFAAASGCPGSYYAFLFCRVS